MAATVEVLCVLTHQDEGVPVEEFYGFASSQDFAVWFDAQVESGNYVGRGYNLRPYMRVDVTPKAPARKRTARKVVS